MDQELIGQSRLSTDDGAAPLEVTVCACPRCVLVPRLEGVAERVIDLRLFYAGGMNDLERAAEAAADFARRAPLADPTRTCWVCLVAGVRADWAQGADVRLVCVSCHHLTLEEHGLVDGIGDVPDLDPETGARFLIHPEP